MVVVQSGPATLAAAYEVTGDQLACPGPADLPNTVMPVFRSEPRADLRY